MDATTRQAKARLMQDLTLEALRPNDERLNGIALALITLFGENPVNCLVSEAANRRNGPKHRVRLLQAIRQIGTVSDPATHMLLISLLNEKDADVRKAAAQVILALQDNLPGMADGSFDGATAVSERRESHDNLDANLVGVGPGTR